MKNPLCYFVKSCTNTARLIDLVFQIRYLILHHKYLKNNVDYLAKKFCRLFSFRGSYSCRSMSIHPFSNMIQIRRFRATLSLGSSYSIVTFVIYFTLLCTRKFVENIMLNYRKGFPENEFTKEARSEENEPNVLTQESASSLSSN